MTVGCSKVPWLLCRSARCVQSLAEKSTSHTICLFRLVISVHWTSISCIFPTSRRRTLTESVASPVCSSTYWAPSSLPQVQMRIRTKFGIAYVNVNLRERLYSSAWCTDSSNRRIWWSSTSNVLADGSLVKYSYTHYTQVQWDQMCYEASRYASE